MKSSPLATRKIIAGVLVVLSILAGFMSVVHFRTEVILVFTAIVYSISIQSVMGYPDNAPY
jgi:hypothetical protein